MRSIKLALPVLFVAAGIAVLGIRMISSEAVASLPSDVTRVSTPVQVVAQASNLTETQQSWLLTEASGSGRARR